MLTPTPQQVFQSLTKGLPKFEDGRINFTDAQEAPVLNAILYFNGKILLVKRSSKVGAYKGLWNGISGFIDQPKPIEDFVCEEMTEELSLNQSVIKTMSVCDPYKVNDPKIKKTWHVYPVLVVLKSQPNIRLNWEHTDFCWIYPTELSSYKHVKDLDISLGRALKRLSD